MGGSFGGYMANWVAGHTDRFRAIVTHASLWALDQFGPTTDAACYWQREMTPEMALRRTPRTGSSSDIRTPMLVIHGDKDYRVPIGEGLRLWYELLSERSRRRRRDDAHRFLYFPDENHWVLKPAARDRLVPGGRGVPGASTCSPRRVRMPRFIPQILG